MDFWRPAIKWTTVFVVAAALVVIGTLAGLRFAGEEHFDTAIGEVTIETKPSVHGEVEAFIPVAGWGIRANAFDAPLTLRAELRSINREALLQASEGDAQVLQQTEADLRSAARSALIRSLAWAVAITLTLLLVATLLWRGLAPRWIVGVLGVTLMVALYGGSALRAQQTFDTTAFESPTYFAKGNEIGRILDLATEARVRSNYGDDFTTIVRSISTALAVGREPRPGGIELYAGSDLHANALVIDPISELVGDDPLLLAGDFGQRGGEAEAALIAPKVAALGSAVIAVSGNHDSDGLMSRLAREGVTVLGKNGRLDADGKFEPPPVVTVAGLKIAGYGDPLQYGGGETNGPDRPVTVDDFEDPEAVESRWRADLLDWFLKLPTPPSILMVHQDGLAQWLAQALRDAGYVQPLTIVSGHDHQQHVDRYGDIIVVDSGTIGAGGVFGTGEDSVGISRLRFETAGRLESVDMISVEPVSGSARASRIVIDSMCPVDRRCSVEPDSGQIDTGE